MRSNVLAGASLLAGVAMAAPRPQDIPFALAEALPNPSYVTTASVVTYDASSVLAAALPQITSVMTSDTDAAPSDAANKVKRSACQPQPTGAGPIPSPDSASAFLALPAFASAATNAPVPSGYSQSFSNLNAANNAYGYMGYSTMSTYDSQACANKCNAINGCMAVNIYFERDPTVAPGTGCDNPASTTNIKCVFWGGPVTSSNAVNSGQYRDNFQVVIAGSNGYVNNSIATPSGYTPAVDLGNAAINAPYDQYGFDTFMGSAIFNSGPYDVNLCAQACNQKSAYNLAHPPTDGSPVETCQFFNTYILYINTTANLQGQVCAMYAESWPKSYATNVGQYRGNDHYLIEYSYMYSNATNAGTASPPPAIHQASRDISYSTLQPFCSSYLGYTTPLTTTTATSYTTPTTTLTVATTTTTVPAKRKRTTGTAAAAALSTPNVLTKYPSAILSAACSLQATAVTSTSTITASTVVTAATTTVDVTATATQTAAATSITCGGGQNFVIQASYNNNFGVGGQGENSGLQFSASTAAGGQPFYLDSNCILTEATGQFQAYQANEDSGDSFENVYFNDPSEVGPNGYAPVTCSVDANNVLSCDVNNGNIYSSENGDYWYLSNSPNAGGTTAITLTAVPVQGASVAS